MLDHYETSNACLMILIIALKSKQLQIVFQNFSQFGCKKYKKAKTHVFKFDTQ